jgi:hypothetical protein
MNTPGLFGSRRPRRCRSWWQIKRFVLNAGTLPSVLLFGNDAPLQEVIQSREPFLKR